MDNKFISIPELEQMRLQLNILKQKLDKQEIVNERVIMASMRKKMSWIKKFSWIEAIILMPLVAIIYAGLKVSLGFSWWSYTALLILGLASTIADFRINKMKEVDWQRENLRDTTLKLLKQKKARKIQIYIEMPFIALILLIMACEVYAAGKLPIELAISSAVGAVIGAIIGFFVAFKLYRKMQRINDDIIQQIKELDEP